jgi:nucleoid-associated protein YgaU
LNLNKAFLFSFIISSAIAPKLFAQGTAEGDFSEVSEVSDAPNDAFESTTSDPGPEEKQKKSSDVSEAGEPTESGTETMSSSETEKKSIESDSGNQAASSGEEITDVDSVNLDDLETSETPDGKETENSSASSSDELEEFKLDIGEGEKKVSEKEDLKKVDENAKKITETKIFDVGKEERELLSKAQNIQGQISDNEWNEVATTAKVDSYSVVKDDWLFKISKKLFGSGYYYPKIWSLNTYITNPHFIEPGMILSFTTGSGSSAPEVKLGKFTTDELEATPGSLGNINASDLANFGEDVKPGWIDEKNNLTKQGVFFQYASEETVDDLISAGSVSLNREYENYNPPRYEHQIDIPDNYDKLGFDKSSKIAYSVKEGFYLSTFVSTNIIQDFGSIVNGPDENIFFTRGDRAFVNFTEALKILPGDMFSIYTSAGKASHVNSDREGYKYSIVGQIKVIRKLQDKWEVEFVEVSGSPQRSDRITAYTPKIERITKTYNSRMVEAAIMSSYNPGQMIIGFGDVIYLDRGRADGLEMGNVLETFGFKDRLSNRNITDQPTYKTGELTVITLTDNFATALVTQTKRDFQLGDIAITKTKEAYLREQKAREARLFGQRDKIAEKELDELDVELNLDNLNDDLLKQADKIQLTEDELAELERQEREKSVIKDSERDLKALERLENEIEQAEAILNDAKLDEDKLLEGENLNDIEKKRKNIDQDSLNEIEENLGKRYVDEDLNSKDNPFGLSEFDIEEVDELLNVEKDQSKK